MIPSPYEERVLREICAWKNKRPSWLEEKVRWLNQPLSQLSKHLTKVPGVEWTLENVVAGLVECANEIAQDTTSMQSTITAFQDKGYDVMDLSDISQLDLEIVDDVLGGIDLRYQSLTAVQGAVAGLAGLAGLAADIVALVALNLRATGQIALHCGFDIRQPRERGYALNILNIALQSEEKDARNAQVLAKKHMRSAIEQATLGAALRGTARILGIRLMKLKLAQVIPVAAVVAGGGFNAYYTARVCETATHLYQERRLRDKYADRVLDSILER